MGVLARLVFAVTHPAVAVRFLARQYRSRLARRYYSYERPTPLLSGAVKITPVFLTGFEPVSQVNLVKEADAIIAGQRCLYGHARFKVKGGTDWQKDYLSGYRWAANFHEDISYRYPLGTDIKSAWELSRLHHLVSVARAYRITKRHRDAEFVAAELTDWIRKNPVYYGVNWKVAMEVGIRAANILAAFALVADSPPARQIESLVLGSMQDHGDYIMNNLEIYGVRSNHYFSDLCGLIWIGVTCPGLPRAKRYRSLGLRELNKEILHQFLPDGLGFEASVSYHRLVLEMLGFTMLLVGKRTFSVAAQRRAALAFRAARALTAPDGQISQIGDNDSGRFFITGRYFAWPATDIRHLQLLERTLFAGKPARPKTSWSFPVAGIEVRSNPRFWMTLAASPAGQDGNAGHNHDDNGSFSLWVDGQPLVVDPGTGCYTSNPALRNSLRAYRTHNGPVVNGQAPEPLAHELFSAGRQVVGELQAGRNQLTASLRAPQWQAKRQVTLGEKSVTVTDTAAGNIAVCLTLHPSVSARKEGNTIRIGKTVLRSNGRIKIGKGNYSPAYARIEPTSTITLTAAQKLTMSFSL